MPLETRARPWFRSFWGNKVRVVTISTAPIGHLMLLKGLDPSLQGRHVLLFVASLLAVRLAVLTVVAMAIGETPVVSAEGLEQLREIFSLAHVLLRTVGCSAGRYRGPAVLAQLHQSLNFDLAADRLQVSSGAGAWPGAL